MSLSEFHNVMDELKPCPFCGGEAEVHPSDDWDASFTGKTFFVWCGKCETRCDYYDTEAEAIAAWNTRAEHTDKLLRCLENDYGIKASWDGLRKVWLTERTVPWDETCEHGLPMTEENMREHGWVREHTCKLDGYTDAAFKVCQQPDETDFTDYAEVCECTACGASVIVPHAHERISSRRDELWPIYTYCPNCGAKVVSK